MSPEETIKLKLIGFVRTSAAKNEVKDGIRGSKMVIREDPVQALDGLRGFSHLYHSILDASDFGESKREDESSSQG